jgi:hypothetical protein
MSSIQKIPSSARLLAVSLSVLLVSVAATAQIASGTTGIDASGNYRHEVQSCMSGNTQQDRATCLREARNANADRRTLSANDANLKANRLARCDALKGEDRDACQARVVGYGDASGSVAGGGVIRQVETIVVPADAASVRVRPQTSNPVIVLEPPKR